MDLEEIGINAGNWVDSAQNMDYWRALGRNFNRVTGVDGRTILELILKKRISM